MCLIFSLKDIEHCPCLKSRWQDASPTQGILYVWGDVFFVVCIRVVFFTCWSFQNEGGSAARRWHNCLFRNGLQQKQCTKRLHFRHPPSPYYLCILSMEALFPQTLKSDVQIDCFPEYLCSDLVVVLSCFGLLPFLFDVLVELSSKDE